MGFCFPFFLVSLPLPSTKQRARDSTSIYVSIKKKKRKHRATCTKPITKSSSKPVICFRVSYKLPPMVHRKRDHEEEARRLSAKIIKTPRKKKTRKANKQTEGSTLYASSHGLLSYRQYVRALTGCRTLIACVNTHCCVRAPSITQGSCAHAQRSSCYFGN